MLSIIKSHHLTFIHLGRLFYRRNKVLLSCPNPHCLGCRNLDCPILFHPIRLRISQHSHVTHHNQSSIYWVTWWTWLGVFIAALDSSKFTQGLDWWPLSDGPGLTSVLRACWHGCNIGYAKVGNTDFEETF